MFYKFRLPNDFDEKLKSYHLDFKIYKQKDFGFALINDDEVKEFFKNHFGVSLEEVDDSKLTFGIEYYLKDGFVLLTPLIRG